VSHHYWHRGRCREWADLEEPLAHNKTAFTLRRLGAGEVKRLKTLCRTLNAALTKKG